jgi:hypothetical protein
MIYSGEAELSGPFGTAFREVLPDRPDTAETVCRWVITAPQANPFWSQYALGVVRLRSGVPGFPEPQLRFVGASHELHVVTLNPEHGPYTPERVAGELDHGLPFLEPVNIVEQFTATDDEMRHLAGLAVLGVLHGLLTPETAVIAPTGLIGHVQHIPNETRERWLTALVKSLAHIRGEEHAS